MKYILVNISCPVNSVTEDILDNKVLKEYAYGSKFKTPVLSYDYILVPLYQTQMTNDFLLKEGSLLSHISSAFELTQDMVYSIYVMLGEYVDKLSTISIDIFRIVDESQLNIIYTDGSSSQKLNTAGFGCCFLTEESNDLDAVVDDFTGKSFKYITTSGKIDEGTNNIGELNGIKSALENLQDKSYQIIISDSIYSIKSFREYIHVWKNNGYKAYNKKDIKNKELIQETYSKLCEKQQSKVVLFKWTKGHANNNFNEICDKLAKKEVGIEEE